MIEPTATYCFVNRVPISRMAGWRSVALTLVSCFALAGCYQAPPWADPAEWAHEVSYQVNSAVAMARNSQVGALPTPEPEARPAAAESAKSQPRQAESRAMMGKSATTAAGSGPPSPAVLPPGPRSAMPSESAPPARHHKPAAAPPASAPPANAAPMPRKTRSAPFAAHLASYRKMESLRKDWASLVKGHPEHLMGLHARAASIDLGAARGRFFRLMAGPLPSRAFAKRLCGALRKKGLYCAVTLYNGRRLG